MLQLPSQPSVSLLTLFVFLNLVGCTPAPSTNSKPASPSVPELTEDTAAAKAMSEIPLIRIVKKNDRISSIDYTQCGDGWSQSLALVPKLPFLDTLILSGPEASDESIAPLAGHPNLQKLGLEQASITDAGIELLAKLPKLDDINLDRCPITDEAMKSLASTKTLKRIRAARTKLSDVGLAYLKEATQLELLDFSDCHRAGRDAPRRNRNYQCN